MSKILVLGGYGGFGARISRRLAAAGHDVLVAGRSAAKAEAYCSTLPGATPLALDRAELVDALAAHRPALVVDASGPFQAMDYSVPRACIAAGISYCDIADGRAFVCGIGVLDAEARAAGVAVIAGASSVPALSGAVVRQLATGLDRVTSVEMAISASNQATAGPAVAAAILGQVGQPVSLFEGKHWTTRYGWQDQTKQDFAIAGVPPVTGRLVALADVPDLELTPARLPGSPACIFRAGTELGFQNRALWLASSLVRWRLLPNLALLAPALERLQGLTAKLGSDRSAMSVSVFGFVGNQRVERRWTLIADRGDGPEIPALSVPLIVDRIVAGTEPPGARDAGLSLQLDEYRDAFIALAITAETREIVLPDPAYRRVMRSDFDRLAKPLQDLHSPLRDAGWRGEATVSGASNWLGRAIARVMGFPPPGQHAVHVSFHERDGVEDWTRDFAGRRFSSELRERKGKLQERFGPLRFLFDLPVKDGGLKMVLHRWSVFGIPLPLILAPRSLAREWAEGGTFYFDVPIALPVVGKVVYYKGWLERL